MLLSKFNKLQRSSDICSANQNYKAMKKQSFTSTARCILGSILFVVVTSMKIPITQRDDTRIVVVSQIPPEPFGSPRVPSSICIEAYYDNEDGLVDVWLRGAGDEVSVDIVNLTTGAYYQYSVSGNGSDSLYIGTDSGCWTITFTLSNGAVYYGEFIV